MAIRERSDLVRAATRSSIEETMLYVHVAETHARELPQEIRDAAIGEADPDARIVKMLGARGTFVPRTEGSATRTVGVTAA